MTPHPKTVGYDLTLTDWLAAAMLWFGRRVLDRLPTPF